MEANSQLKNKSKLVGLMLLFALVLLLLIAGFADWSNNQRFMQAQRGKVGDELAVVRARMEGIINANLETVSSLVSVISLEPELSQQRFSLLAEQIFRGRTQLRNIGAAPDMVIRYVYPLQGNEAALGFDYRSSPKQWQAAQRARNSGELVVAGPVNLRQGGQGFIGRIPVYVARPDGSPGAFWGLVSAVIDVEKFFQLSELDLLSAQLQVAIRGRDGDLQNADVFYGDPTLFKQQPVTAYVSLPSGAWELAAVPRGGWPAVADNAWVVRLSGALVVALYLLAGIFIYRLSRLRDTQEARLQSLFELSPVGIALNDFASGNFIEVNRALVEPSGYTAAEFVQLNYWALTPKHYEKQEAEQLESLKRTGRYGPYEKEYIRKDGSRYPVLLNGVLVADASGKECIWSIVEDISTRKAAQQALEQTRAQLLNFFELSTSLMCVTDANGQFNLLNSAFSNVLGYSKAELKQKPFLSFIHPEDQAATLAELKMVAEGKQTYAFSNRCRRKSGDYVYLNWSATQDPATNNVYAMAMDVSQQREHEVRLKQQQEMLESMSQQARIGAWEFNLVDKTVFWSDMTRVMHEVAVDFEPGMEDFLGFFKPGKSRNVVERALQLCSEQGLEFSEEVQIVTAGGRHLWVLITGKAEIINGICRRVYGSFQDIDARKLIEQDVAKANQNLARQIEIQEVISEAQAHFIEQSDFFSAFHSLLDNLVKLTRSEFGFIGEILYLENDDPYLRTWVFSGVEIQKYLQFFNDGERGDAVEFYNLDSLIGRSLTSLEPVISDDCNTDPRAIGLPSGHPRMISYMGFPVTHGGRGIAMVGLANRPGGYDTEMLDWLQPIFNTVAQFVDGARGIKARREAEQALVAAKETAELAAQAKSDFLAIMSHEIRTPLNGVMGMLNLLSRSQLSAEQSRKLTIASQSSSALLTIINDILDFSKVDAGKIELESIDFNLAAQLEEFADSMAIRAHEKNLELVLDLTEVHHPMVCGDPGRIRQILTNLVSNAIKFTDSGEIVVRCSLAPNSDDMEFRVSVIDTGIGIPREKLADLFDPFTQVDASTTREYGGTGLGLAICKKMCELMGGGISVRSEPGDGSEFSFNLHLKRSAKSFSEAFFNLNGKHVWVVAENSSNRELLRALLSNWGAQVQVAHSADYFIKTILHGTQEGRPLPAAVLIDRELPDMDGPALAKLIKATESTAQVPLVVMSHIGESEYHKLMQAGFISHLNKPVTTNKLRSCLQQTFSGEGTLGNGLAAPEKTSLAGDAPLQSTAASAENSLQAIAGGVSRVLIVEDNPVNQDVARMMLDDLGVVVDTAGNGLEALEALHAAECNDCYSLIFMDCQMPEMDGYEATRQIRAGRGGEHYVTTPIVAMTANAMKGDREKCLAAGMDDYIAKPIDPHTLESKIDKWLNKQFLAVVEGAKTAQKNEVSNVQDLDKGSPAPQNLWDREGLLLSLKNREDRMRKLVSVFNARLPDTLEDFKHAVDMGDIEKIGFIAHSLKGSAGQLKAEPLHLAARQLEMAAKQNNSDEVKALSPPFAEQVNQLRRILDQYLGE